MKLILSASSLSQDDLEVIWQRTQSISAMGLREGFWTLLEVFVALHFVQSVEQLSLDKMAVLFAGSVPPELTNEIRRTSSYIKTGPTLRHSVSNATSLTEITRLRIDESHEFGDTASLSQPGLEVLDVLHHASVRHLGNLRNIRRNSSQRTTSTIGAQRIAALIQSRCPNIEMEPEIGWA